MSMASQAGQVRLAGSAVAPDEEPEEEEPAEAEVSPPAKRKSTKAVPETPVPKRRQSVEALKKQRHLANRQAKSLEWHLQHGSSQIDPSYQAELYHC